MNTRWVQQLAGCGLCATLALAGALVAASASAQVLLKEPPATLAAADIVEHRGETAALDTRFTDQTGKPVRFGDFFDGKRPVVLVLGYFTCPVVCPVVFHNTQSVFNELAWKLGKEYRAVTISFDHTDTPSMAADQQAALLGGVRRKTSDEAWPFLTGSAEEVRRLCDSLGWEYSYIPKTGDFAHPTGLIVLSPDGEISNYLYGVKYKERQLRLSLVAASDGKIGDVFDRILLRCCNYDPDAGGYVLAAQKVMKYAGLTTVALLTGVIGALVTLDRRRTRRRAHASLDPAHGNGSDE